jgi:hypothetical protein
VTGTKELATVIKSEIKQFLNEKLKIELSEEKTKISHVVRDKTLYLGFNISGRHRRYTESQISKVDTVQKQRRGGNSQLVIEAPIERIMESLEKKGFKTKDGQSKAKVAWINLRIEDIIQRYN